MDPNPQGIRFIKRMKISLQPEEEKRSEVKWDATEKHKAEAEGGRRAKGRRDRTDHETNERTTAATRTKKKSE